MKVVLEEEEKEAEEEGGMWVISGVGEARGTSFSRVGDDMNGMSDKGFWKEMDSSFWGMN